MAQIEILKPGGSTRRQQTREEADKKYNDAVASLPEDRKENLKNFWSAMDAEINATDNAYRKKRLQRRKEKTSKAYAFGTWAPYEGEITPEENALGFMTGRDLDQITYKHANQYLGGISPESIPTAAQTMGQVDPNARLEPYQYRYTGWVTGQPGNSGGGTTDSATEIYEFNPLFGFNVDSYGPNTSISDRAKGLAQHLMQNLKGFKDGYKDGVILRGIKSAGLDSIPGIIQSLNTLSTKQGELSPEEIQSILSVFRDANVFGYYTGAINTTLRSLFPELYKEPTQAEQNKKALLNDGYSELDVSSLPKYVQDQLKNKKLNILQKGENYFIYDQNWNPYTKGLKYLNDDWTQEGKEGSEYGYGMFSDEDGNLWMGNTQDVLENNEHQWYEPINTYITNLRNQREGIANQGMYNQLTSSSEDNLINRVANYLGSNFKYTDVSNFFGTNLPIIALNGNGQTELQRDRYGSFKFDNNSVFYYIDPNDGKLHKANFEQLKNKLRYNQRGFGEGDTTLGPITNLAASLEGVDGELDLDTDILGRSWGQRYLGKGSGLLSTLLGYNNFGINRLWDDDGGGIFFNKTIGDDPVKFMEYLNKALENPNQNIDNGMSHYHVSGWDLLNSIDYNNKGDQIIAALVNLVRDKPEMMKNPKVRILVRKLLKAHQARHIQMEKNGGVLKAAYGTQLDVAGNEVTTKNKSQETEKSVRQQKKIDTEFTKAEEGGYDGDVSRMHKDQENLSKHFSVADGLRLATMAQDVASIVASFGSATGVGAAAAAGLGAGALATDMAADILDPSVSAGQVLKNGLINAGFAVVGMIPGAKVGKVAKNLIKWAPRIMMAASTYGLAMDESNQKTWKKIASGKTKDLTREDWKNVAHTITGLAAVVRGGRSAYDKYGKAGNRFKGLVKNKDVEQFRDANGNERLVSKEVKTKADKLLKEGKVEEAGRLKDLEGNEIGQNAFTEKTSGSMWNRLRGRGESKYTFETTPQKELDYGKAANLLAKSDAELVAWARRNNDFWGRMQMWYANKLGGGAYNSYQREAFRNLNIGPNLSSYIPAGEQARGRSGIQNTSALQAELRNKLPAYEVNMPDNAAMIAEMRRIQNDPTYRSKQSAVRTAAQANKDINDPNNPLAKNVENYENYVRRGEEFRNKREGRISAAKDKINKLDAEQSRELERIDKMERFWSSSKKRNTFSRGIKDLKKEIAQTEKDALAAKPGSANAKKLVAKLNSLKKQLDTRLKHQAAMTNGTYKDKFNQLEANIKAQKDILTKEQARLANVMSKLNSDKATRDSAKNILTNERNNAADKLRIAKEESRAARKALLTGIDGGTVQKDFMINSTPITGGTPVRYLNAYNGKNNLSSSAIRFTPEQVKAALNTTAEIKGAALDGGVLYIWKSGGVLDRVKSITHKH